MLDDLGNGLAFAKTRGTEWVLDVLRGFSRPLAAVQAAFKGLALIAMIA
jgi:hypothetical protein